MWGQSTRTVLLLSTPAPCAGLTPGFLKQNDIRLVSTHDTDQALRVARDRAPDLVIQEIVGDPRTAREFRRRLKADPRTRSAPVLVVGGPAETSSCVSARVSRPIVQREYFEAVRRFIQLPERRALRQQVNLRFRFRFGERSGQAFSRDLSSSGAFLKTDVILPDAGETLDLEFDLPGSPLPIRTEARVHRNAAAESTAPGGAGFAVEFIGLPDADLERLEAFIRQIAKKKGSLFGLLR